MRERKLPDEDRLDVFGNDVKRAMRQARPDHKSGILPHGFTGAIRVRRKTDDGTHLEYADRSCSLMCGGS